METEKILKYEPTLPANFTGVFHFTNWTDEEFVGVWGSKEYHFPPRATSPMVMPEQTPLEIQHIRKHFAKKLAEREFFKSQKYEMIRSPEGTLGNRTMSGIHQAGTYTLDDLKDGIQRCLEALEIQNVVVAPLSQTPLEEKLTRNSDGELNTAAIGSKDSLRARALDGKGLSN